MYTKTTTFKLLQLLSLSLIVIISVYYVNAINNKVRIETILNIFLYVCLVYLYAFHIFSFFARFFPIMSKFNLISKTGTVVNLDSSRIVSSGVNNKVRYRYNFNIDQNIQCVIHRENIQLNIKNKDHVKVVGLGNPNGDYINIIALKNYTKNSTAAINILLYCALAFLGLLLPMIITLELYGEHYKSMESKYIAILFSNLISIPTIVFFCRPIDEIIEALYRLISDE